MNGIADELQVFKRACQIKLKLSGTSEGFLLITLLLVEILKSQTRRCLWRQLTLEILLRLFCMVR